MTSSREYGLDRRSFLHQSLTLAAGCACGLRAGNVLALPLSPGGSALISPGCRRSKVKVAKLYLGVPKAHWPTPNMDVVAEMKRYEAAFAKMHDEFADVDFIGNKLVTKKEDLADIRSRLPEADGVLLIHLSMGISEALREVLAANKPTLLFAAPYSGHEWAGFGALRNEPGRENLECLLTSDLRQLAAGVRPFRAIHHLREAKVLNLTTRPLPTAYTSAIASKFGTEIKNIDLPKMMAAYESIAPGEAEAECRRWMRDASKVVEPSRDELLRS
jgi:hypothetical protein